MGFKTVTAMDERRAMIADWQTGRYSKAELARRYGVSRTTLYKWLGRYQRCEGLEELSRAPRNQPRRTSAAVERQILELRGELPLRGAAKLKAIWEEAHAEQPWPARSTIAGILKRHGLTVNRRRRRVPPSTNGLTEPDTVNRVWCGDFKGWFLAQDGSRCEPLTICDAASRYLLCCQMVTSTGWQWVRPLFEVAFRAYGMPDALRTDNGSPFATTAPAGLSELSVWLIRLGVKPERIQPGCPQQNGRLERLHQTLKKEAATPPAATWSKQQAELDRFQVDYNEKRPHEALGQKPPASVYTPSPRSFPARLPEIEYPVGYRLRRVSRGGQLKWAGHEVFLTRALHGEVVGLEALDDRLSRIWFGPLELGLLDAATGQLQRR